MFWLGVGIVLGAFLLSDAYCYVNGHKAAFFGPKTDQEKVLHQAAYEEVILKSGYSESELLVRFNNRVSKFQ